MEKAGINVDELVKLLVSNAEAELPTFYYYTILRVNLIGMDGEGLKEIEHEAWFAEFLGHGTSASRPLCRNSCIRNPATTLEGAHRCDWCAPLTNRKYANDEGKD